MPAAPMTLAPAGRRLRAVVADAHAPLRAAIRDLLELEGAEVVAEAGDRAGTLAAVRATRPDVVVLDLRLAGREGLGVLVAVRAAWPAANVVLHTTTDGPSLRREARPAGAAEVVVKGTSPGLLLDAVRRAGAARVWSGEPDSWAPSVATVSPAPG